MLTNGNSQHFKINRFRGMTPAEVDRLSSAIRNLHFEMLHDSDCACDAAEELRRVKIEKHIVPHLDLLGKLLLMVADYTKDFPFAEGEYEAKGYGDEHPVLTLSTTGPKGGDASYGGTTTLTIKDINELITVETIEGSYSPDGLPVFKQVEATVAGDWEGRGYVTNIIRLAAFLLRDTRQQ